MTIALRRWLPALAVGLLAGVAAAPSAGAFCLYNDTESKLEFEVDTDGAGNNAPYRRNIGAGSGACCDWGVRHCNRSGQAEQVLKFGAKRVVGMMEWTCFRNGRADADLHLTRHDGAAGCSWRSGSGAAAGSAIWEAILETVRELLWGAASSKG
jgi:hypothetical protein